MSKQQTASTEAKSDALVGELLELLAEAQRLGLTFDCGSAYISRAYIEKQDALNARIKAVQKKARAS